MTSRAKSPSKILAAVHETARDLHAAGFIDMRSMKHYDALCLAPVPAYSGAKIRALRDRHKLSQAVFASVLNTSLSTVRQWEIGDKHPSGPSLKLLSLLDRKGLEVLI
jgi:putative transcriptional regulator